MLNKYPRGFMVPAAVLLLAATISGCTPSESKRVSSENGKEESGFNIQLPALPKEQVSSQEILSRLIGVERQIEELRKSSRRTWRECRLNIEECDHSTLRHFADVEQLPDAQYEVAKRLHKQRDVDSAKAYYEAAGNNGVADAWYELGRISMDEENKIEAERYFRVAVDMGHGDAMQVLGVLLADGDGGVSRDLHSAYELFHNAVTHRIEPKNIQNLRYALGLYSTGNWYGRQLPGYIQDYREAARWFGLAAEQGYGPAQLELAKLYEEGQGVDRNYVEAYKWYQIATSWFAKNEYPYWKENSGEANKGRDRIRAYLKARILDAERAVNQWEAKIQIRTGTGFYISPDHIITNEHVVRDCQEIRIPPFYPVEHLGDDERLDIAVLKTNKPVPIWARLRPNGGVRAGEQVIVLGHPYDRFFSLDPSITVGSVSAITGLNNNSGRFRMTAPVQRGNSGGPVLDVDGDVIGITVEKFQSYGSEILQNLNYAVSISSENVQTFIGDHTDWKGQKHPDFYKIEKNRNLIEDDLSRTKTVLTTDKYPNSILGGRLISSLDKNSNPVDKDGYIDVWKSERPIVGRFGGSQSTPFHYVPYYKTPLLTYDGSSARSDVATIGEKAKDFTVLVECWVKCSSVDVGACSDGP